MLVATIREWQYKQMEDNIKAVEWLVRSSEPQALMTFRDGGSGWTVLEVVCHLRDFEKVFHERARRTVEQDNPPLPFPDPDALAREGRYSEQGLEAALAAWQERRASLLAYLRSRDGADWERPAQHPTRGEMSLFDQLFLVPQHDSLHLEQMTRTLYEKKKG
ncbi:MAG: DinB family protein [Anaerolineae bacterium]|nr:DinB family protein [Anaerolineae bacterium]